MVSFLRKIFGRPDPVESKMAFVRVMENMASEADRIHRAQVSMIAEEFHFGGVSGIGLYKARLQAAMIPACVYPVLTKDMEGALELINVASGVAIRPLVEEGADVRLDREQARVDQADFPERAHKAALLCIKEGPFPPTPGQETPAFQALEELVHEALADSLGKDRYFTVHDYFGPSEMGLLDPVDRVSPRDRLDHLINGYVRGEVIHMMRMLDG